MYPYLLKSAIGLSVLFFGLISLISKEICYFSFFTQCLIFITFYSNPILSGWELIDNFNFMLICFSLFLGGMVTMLCPSKQVPWVVSIFLIIFLFFSTESFVIFFVCYELSLVPLLILLTVWGTQAERIEACQFMLLYTIICSSPLLMMIIYTVSLSQSMGVALVNSSFPLMVSGVMTSFILAFFVKAPILTLHSWLPKAHVESPVEGSMILAGIMLKFGVYGLLRMVSIFHLPEFLKTWIFYFCLISSIIACSLAIASDDMKMSVAYSSISHMNFLLSSIFSDKLIILKGSVLSMVSHGISSPLLFVLVTKIYFLSHSRSILISKGLGSKLPLLALFAFISWSFNFSVPPTLSFISEISIISSIISFSYGTLSMIFICIYVLTISFFSILNYGVIFHSPFKIVMKGDLSTSMVTMIVLLSGSILMIITFFFVENLWM